MRLLNSKCKKGLYSFLCLFLAMLILSISTTFSVSALSDPIQALRKDRLKYTIFKENNVMFWNPYENNLCAEMYGPGWETDDSDDVENMSDNGQTIFNYLVKSGYSASSAGAIIGNLVNESGLNPRILQGGKVVNSDFVAYKNGSKTFSGGFGLAQWTSAGRVKNLQDFADSLRQSVTSLTVQVKFLVKELNSYGLTPSVLNSLNYREATRKVLSDYEGPADQSEDELKERMEAGEDYAGLDVDNLTYDEDEEGNEIAVVCVRTDEKEEEDDEDTGMPLGDDEAYRQCDPKWGNLAYGSSTLCRSGCGVISFATILSYLTGKGYTPADVVKIANQHNLYVPGVGSSHQISSVLAQHYGLTSTKISANDISSYLKKGYMIHVSGKGSSPYSRNGHYIAIVGTTSNGNWKVATSGGKVVEMSPSKVTTGMNNDNIYAIGK